MTTFAIPQVPADPASDPKPQNPGQGRQIGDTPKPRKVTASKKVDDLSRHESKHSPDPRQDPKRAGGEKVSEPSKPAFQPLPAHDPIPGKPKK